MRRDRTRLSFDRRLQPPQIDGAPAARTAAPTPRSERDASHANHKTAAGRGEPLLGPAGSLGELGGVPGRIASCGGNHDRLGAWMTSSHTGEAVLSPEFEAIAAAGHDRLRAQAGGMGRLRARRSSGVLRQVARAAKAQARGRR